MKTSLFPKTPHSLVSNTFLVFSSQYFFLIWFGHFLLFIIHFPVQEYHSKRAPVYPRVWNSAWHAAHIKPTLKVYSFKVVLEAVHFSHC